MRRLGSKRRRQSGGHADRGGHGAKGHQRYTVVGGEGIPLGAETQLGALWAHGGGARGVRASWVLGRRHARSVVGPGSAAALRGEQRQGVQPCSSKTTATKAENEQAGRSSSKHKPQKKSKAHKEGSTQLLADMRYGSAGELSAAAAATKGWQSVAAQRGDLREHDGE